ncbi:endonuclease [Saprospiraceae bacterium]|nr:endonuclease [Bacteroidota bacterium]MDB4727785.1 endonuclease [Saprospiraceae bacterium]MDF1864050.1 endonuclease [Saprospiraceae bacterium]
MNKHIAFLFLTFCCFNLKAQFHQSVFPGDFGQVLLDKLVDNYKPVLNLTQGMARDTLFGNIDSPNDSMTCVYSGYKIYLNPNGDPTQTAFDLGLNTEHTFPQSLGATGQARGDMHHLYATRADVNADRGNLPFGEIADNQTDEWYYLDNSQSNIPTQNIDLYSERTSNYFEVPEAHKGNVARSMFYFYTMYKDQADAANANFFESQRTTLCAWHFADRVDQNEWDRNLKISEYQDGKPNPYILDCTLPERTFCQNFGGECDPLSTGSIIQELPFQIEQNTPNPFQNETQIKYRLNDTFLVKILILNHLGQVIDTVLEAKQTEGNYILSWSSNNKNLSGLVFCQFLISNGTASFSSVKKMVVLP